MIIYRSPAYPVQSLPLPSKTPRGHLTRLDIDVEPGPRVLASMLSLIAGYGQVPLTLELVRLEGSERIRLALPRMTRGEAASLVAAITRAEKVRWVRLEESRQGEPDAGDLKAFS